MISNELLKRIRANFDLNSYETKVWIALLEKGVSTAGDIAKSSNVPRSRCYDVLEGLERRGFAMMKVGKPVKYIAVSPHVIVDKIKTNFVREAEERSNAVEEMKGTDDYNQIELLYKHSITPIRPEELSGFLKGRTNFHSHLKSILLNAGKEVLLVTNAEALKRKARVLRVVLPELRKRKISFKLAVKGDEENIKALEKVLGTEITRTNLDSRFCIVDKKHVVFMLNPHEEGHEENGLWIQSSYFANALSELFKAVK